MRSILFSCLLFYFIGAQAQVNYKAGDTTIVKQQVDSINRLLDRSVVSKHVAVLQKHYAEDFVFTHGTGLVDSKASWMKNVLDTATHYVSREHDSTNVELHNDVAIIIGILTVQRKQQDKISRYGLRYVRVYQLRRTQWQLISHRTTAEWHYD
ncbi:MAG: nuclear transport factor 2 family protein [Bacteroidota bacterium]|nr:nuclear transport factor 2 family protein [Flavisolibacter sp.]MBD0349782.1 nuclear transport factor 2 family protein [Flavisolibacter sp.]MBD0368768.1 nuclear transport factor 2 family protein [Flavisolibacter sp.]MBD0375599.1 nuclear transport factor 2 family protein [Flavisolibacter sp.]MDQ3842633.1 nuclear transport factor 2 family protein [Bacteroidota bacterium]